MSQDLQPLAVAKPLKALVDKEQRAYVANTRSPTRPAGCSAGHP
ncbi:hypothetical protein [Caballeronia sp.]